MGRVARDGTRGGHGRRCAVAAALVTLLLAGCGSMPAPRPAAPTPTPAPLANDGLPLAADRAEVSRLRIRAAAAARRAELRRLRGLATPEAAVAARCSPAGCRRSTTGGCAATSPPPAPRSGAWAARGGPSSPPWSATVDELAATGRLGLSRLRPVLLVLRRNTQTWTRAPFPAARERRTFGKDPAVFEYYPATGCSSSSSRAGGARTASRTPA